VAAVPRRPRAAGVPRVRLGSLPRVNQRFADAVVAEARSDNPVVLVQDYHFALLPAMIRERLPQATILTFWHIPWPNPESFGICPWRREILQGMLGSTILGFHTRFHCKNFIETVDRYLEARIEHEHSTIAHGTRKRWSRVTRSRSSGRAERRWRQAER
jgi:trehalose-6-phosphate synthase